MRRLKFFDKAAVFSFTAVSPRLETVSPAFFRALTLSATPTGQQPASMRSGVDKGCQKDVSQPVHTQTVQIGLSEIQLESAPEVLDASLEFVSAE